MNALEQIQTMSSIEIAGIADKAHNNVLKAIRAMEPSWEKVTGVKFYLSEYTDASGRKLPCYELTQRECLYVATKFNDEARAKLIVRWEQLENDKVFQIPQTLSAALMLAAQQAEQIEVQQKQIETQAQQLDQSKDWYTIKRYAKENGMNWRSINWRALKAISYELGYAVKKIFDANYGQVNIYHLDVFKVYFSNGILRKVS